MSKKQKKRAGSAKKRNKSDMPVSVEDLGPIERWRHRFGMVAPTAAANASAIRSVAVLEIRDRTVDGGGRVTGTGAHNKIEQPLDYMHDQGWLGDTHTEEGERIARWRLLAGTKFRDLFEGASISRRTTVNYDTVGGGGIYHDESDEEADTRMEFNRTMRALGNNGNLAISVCCNRFFLPQGNAILLKRLIEALDLLADRFNIADDERKRRHAIRGTMYD